MKTIAEIKFCFTCGESCQHENVVLIHYIISLVLVSRNLLQSFQRSIIYLAIALLIKVFVNQSLKLTFAYDVHINFSDIVMNKIPKPIVLYIT